ncbi:hypothetical protein [Streptomyces sp. NBC_00470]|uniref:hypothetical protein n=1 Tax=Streptomyces sp. NBC_00470 TaxID=2975753 RepID=UPI0030DF3138
MFLAQQLLSPLPNFPSHYRLRHALLTSSLPCLRSNSFEPETTTGQPAHRVALIMNRAANGRDLGSAVQGLPSRPLLGAHKAQPAGFWNPTQFAGSHRRCSLCGGHLSTMPSPCFLALFPLHDSALTPDGGLRRLPCNLMAQPTLYLRL